MDYTNAFAGLPDANLPNNPFYSGINQSRREQTMLPFLRNANIQSDVETSTAQQKQMEFMSPEAQAMRKAKINEGTVEANTNASQIPLLAAEVNSKNAAAQQLRPQQTRNQKLTLEQEYRTLQGKPQGELFKLLGNAADAMEKLPEMARPGALKSIVDQFRQTNPGVELPEEIDRYEAQTLPAMKMMAQVAANTPEQRGKVQVTGMTEAGDDRRNAATNQTNLRIAQGHDTAAAQRNERSLEEGNLARQMYTLRSALAPGSKATPEQRNRAESMLYQYVVKETDDAALKDAGIKGLGEMAALRPNDRETLFKEIDKRKAILLIKRLKTNGILPRLSDIKAARPEMSVADIRRAFKEEFGREVKE